MTNNKQYDANRNLITPKNSSELEYAFRKYQELSVQFKTATDNKKTQIEEQMNQQLDLVHEFVDNLGTYDPSILQRNIAYLAKTYNLKMADVEECLNLSAGYIAKMLNFNTNKRMSLDQAWKISRLFDTDLNTLLTTDIQNQRGNTALVLRFIKKLTKMTRNAEIEWINCGGNYCKAYYIDDDDILITGGILRRINEDVFRYMIDSDEEGFELEGDIMCLRGFISPTEDLYLVPYHQPWTNEDDTSYDFLAIKNANYQPGKDEIIWRKIFDFIEALDNTVDNAAGKLYSTIIDMYFDAKIDPADKAFIENFLKD